MLSRRALLASASSLSFSLSSSAGAVAPGWIDAYTHVFVRGLRFPIYGLPTPQWSAYRDMLAEALKRDWPSTARWGRCATRDSRCCSREPRPAASGWS